MIGFWAGGSETEKQGPIDLEMNVESSRGGQKTVEGA